MKDNRKSKNAAPWGTLNWIATYPYSQMDRKRRKRAVRVVGMETLKDILKGPSISDGVAEIWRLCGKYGVTITKSAAKKLSKNCEALASLETATIDAAFGSALAKAWGLAK